MSRMMLRVGLVLISSALLAPVAFADPQVLCDQQLDRITAGNTDPDPKSGQAVGGAIVANESTASLTDSASVSLSGSAQADARAVSLVNSADALVGSGLNISRTSPTEASIGSEIVVDQMNKVDQSTTLTSAQLVDYSRNPETLHDVQTWADSIPALRAIKFDLTLNIKDVGSFEAGGEIPASVIPSSKIPGAKGTVVGFAGELGVDYEGGNLEVDLDLASAVEGRAHLAAEGESEAFFGFITGPSSKVSSTTKAGVDFNPWLSIYSEGPDLSIDGEGAVCYAHGGDCTASSVDREIGKLSLPSAQAEYIVVDRSKLTADRVDRVDLDGGAQADARGVVMVNAAGGLVGNGVNISTSRGGDSFEPAENGIAALALPLLKQLQENQVVQAVGDDEDSGSVRGGAIVANESQATLTETASVSLNESAQAGARALSLTNSADALVGNGLNVWDGPVQDAFFSEAIEVDQLNQLTQGETLSSAKLVDYQRDRESLRAFETSAHSAATPKYLQTDIELEIFDGAESIGTLSGNLEIPDTIIPTTKVPGVGGTVVGYAGDVDVDLDGGTTTIEFGIEDSGFHFETNNHAEGSSGNLGLFTANGNADLGVDMGLDLDTSLRIEIDMPDLEIASEGAICFAQKGTCSAGVLDRDIGVLDVDRAEAEHIVVDRSKLTANETHSVELGSEAQAGARAVALVNAAGGLVANGINIASLPSEVLDTPILALKQRNEVLQMVATGAPDAGAALGGTIVANESIASLMNSASVGLDDSAQAEVRAVSLVNSADALVGNGINIWNGDLVQASLGTAIEMDQLNEIAQGQVLTSARLVGYDRAPETLRDVQTATSTKAIIPEPHPLYPEAHPAYIRGQSELDIPDVVNLKRTGQVPITIIPTSKIPGGTASAAGFAGDLLVEYDGGALDLDFGFESLAESHTIASVDGTAEAFFGMVKGEGKSSYAEDISAGQTTLLEVDVDMPDLSIDVEGAACYAQGANCSARVLERELGNLHVDKAEAEYVAIDRSRLTASETNSIVLDGSAQAGARALTLVNAAGGLVANGINLSSVRSEALSANALNLKQRNHVVQKVAAHDADLEKESRPARGGSIVANEATASLIRSASVSLDESAQAGARALSLVNSADALVATGLNVWDGDLANVSFGGTPGIDQRNDLHQEFAPVSGQLATYRRGAESLRDVQSVADSRAVPQYIKVGFKLEVLDPANSGEKLGSYSEGLIAPASAIPTSKVPGAYGIVAGFAGEADVQYGGGSADARLENETGFHYSNLAKTEISAGDFLGFGKIEGKAEFGVGLDAEFAPTLVIHADLPELRIQADGAICYANGGECKAGVLERQIGPLNVKSAEAEHVVVDRSELNASTNYSISLNNSAQANARALTIVNAAGGLVGNGINVSNVQGSALSAPALNVLQRNVVIQRR